MMCMLAAKDVIQADGYNLNTRMVIVANGQMPGPTLDVYENQTLVIKVNNHLYSDGMQCKLVPIDSVCST